MDLTAQKTIFQNILKDYDGQEFARDVEKTSLFIEKTFSAKEDACIVCYEDIERKDQIWSCPNCYSQYHLACISKWVRENIAAQQRKAIDNSEQYAILLAEEMEQDAGQLHARLAANAAHNLHWSCPTCREEYPLSRKPERYFCFCGKVQDPPADPWILPHSCGEHCHKTLQGCEHRCTLLCHPGPCPPCPRQVSRVSCACGRGGERTVRCSQRLWSCGSICNLPLACGEHRCGTTCHAPPCAPCKQVSLRRCACGKEKKMGPCDSATWHCEQICCRALACGNHTCTRKCHVGNCGSCPWLAPRQCPCGKKQYPGLTSCEPMRGQNRKNEEAESQEDSETFSEQLRGPPCEETCGRMLSCGSHRCQDKCHRGGCGPCRATVTRKCRCGATKQSLQCCKGEFTCQTKCARLRDCGRHPCRRKCCAGRGEGCAPCDQICNLPLGCGHHRCKARCHAGPCYPCREKMTLTCPCGQTQRQVPCGLDKKAARLVQMTAGHAGRRGEPSVSELSQGGSKKSTIPGLTVSCIKNCPKPSRCRHTNPHGCHDAKAECPPCTQICDLALLCGHRCLVPCHEAVPHQRPLVPKGKPTVPWARDEARVDWVNEPCPPCRVAVPVRCRGLHCDLRVPCCDVRPEMSCGQQCARLLACDNHNCQLECHSVEPTCRTVNMRSKLCELCPRDCSKPRPAHCVHPCGLVGCHPGPCPPCQRLAPPQMCHCGQLQIHLDCVEYCRLLATSKEALDAKLCCPATCERALEECKHTCRRQCHSGPCETTDETTVCSAKVTVKCACAKRKFRFLCGRVRKGFQEMPEGFRGMDQRPQLTCDFEKGCVKKKSLVPSDEEGDEGETPVAQALTRRQPKKTGNKPKNKKSVVQSVSSRTTSKDEEDEDDEQKTNPQRHKTQRKSRQERRLSTEVAGKRSLFAAVPTFIRRYHIPLLLVVCAVAFIGWAIWEAAYMPR